MKRFLNPLVIINLLVSGVASITVATPTVNSNNKERILIKDNAKILEENIINLDKIDQELIVDSLIQRKNNVILNYELFLNQNLTNEFINLIKDYQFENTNIKGVEQLLFKNQLSQINTYSIKEWRARGQAPKKWYEWIAGVWRLEFNHALIQDIIHGFETFNDIIGIVTEAGIYANAAVIASAILTLSSNAIAKADLGNGVLFRFATWIIPTQIRNSTYNWS